MRNLNGFLLVARHAFGRLLMDKRTLGLLLLAAFPGFFAFMQVTFDSHVTVGEFTMAMLYIVLQTILPLAALVVGVAVMGDEIEGRTVTYLFTRPLARPVLYLGRLAGSSAAGGLLVALAVVVAARIFARQVALSDAETVATVGIAVGGFAVYTAFFAALRLLFRRALYIGFVLAVIFEGWVSKLPVSGFAKCSLWHHLALLQVRVLDADVATLPVPSSIGPAETAGGSLQALAWVLVVCLAGGAWLVRSREIRIPAAVA
ncbi:MAG: hypothetical protein ACYTEZ_11090 [Planctomycetota bacterium]|jgi:hypothetical protein